MCSDLQVSPIFHAFFGSPTLPALSASGAFSILMVFAILLLPLYPVTASAEPIPTDQLWIRYTWTAPRLLDSEGLRHAEAIMYLVYVTEDDEPLRYVGAALDTTLLVRLERGRETRVMVIGMDTRGWVGPSSPLSEPVIALNGLEPIQELPTALHLRQNYPNPFNPSTTISYEIPESVDTGARVTLEIYDVLGRRIRFFSNLERSPGVHAVQWNGRSDAGRPQPTGVYIALLRRGSDVQAVKMQLVK